MRYPRPGRKIGSSKVELREEKKKMARGKEKRGYPSLGRTTGRSVARVWGRNFHALEGTVPKGIHREKRRRRSGANLFGVMQGALSEYTSRGQMDAVLTLAEDSSHLEGRKNYADSRRVQRGGRKNLKPLGRRRILQRKKKHYLIETGRGKTRPGREEGGKSKCMH